LTSVIVIDDEKDVLDVFCEYLTVKNIQILGTGSNGKDAVELYKKYKPDVVLMDLVMSDYDGFYGLEKIRQEDPDSKIIIFSASLTPHYIERLKELKVSGIATKPYDMDRVIDLISNISKGKTIDLTNKLPEYN
jgi:two-component system, chemotaxis family, chemotaxis protein CheY